MTNILFFANTDWYLLNFRSALMHSVQTEGYSVRCVSPPGVFGPQLNVSGLAWQALPFERDSRFGMLRSLWRVRRALRRMMVDESPAIVHSFTLTSILLTWLSLPRPAPMVRINAVTGMGYAFTGHSFKHRCLRVLLRPLMSRALNHPRAWTVVQNTTDRDVLIQQFRLDPDRVRLIPGSGVDVQRFRPDDSARPDRRVRVGVLARLLHDKGIAEFVHAADQLQVDWPEVQFLVAGESDPGNPAAIGSQTLRAWGQLPNVEFTGHVDDVPTFLNSLDLFVLPSYREGLSRSLIEAGACGLPLVTTDVPGCRDVVRDGEQGLVVPARDAKALAQAIDTLLRDDQLRQRLGAAARARVENEFSNDSINQATLALYREVLGEGLDGTANAP